MYTTTIDPTDPCVVFVLKDGTTLPGLSDPALNVLDHDQPVLLFEVVEALRLRAWYDGRGVVFGSRYDFATPQQAARYAELRSDNVFVTQWRERQRATRSARWTRRLGR